MDELMDLLIQDESPSAISDSIKSMLFAKSAERITDLRPEVAASVFENDVNLDGGEEEVEFEDDYEVEKEE